MERCITCQGKVGYYPQIKNGKQRSDLISWERCCYDSKGADLMKLWVRACDSI